MNILQAREMVRRYDEIMGRKFGPSPKEIEAEKIRKAAERRAILFRHSALERGARIAAAKVAQRVERVEGGFRILPKAQQKQASKVSRCKGIFPGRNEKFVCYLNEKGWSYNKIAKFMKERANDLSSLKTRSSVRNIIKYWKSSPGKYAQIDDLDREEFETWLQVNL